jgi:hypothetical protein
MAVDVVGRGPESFLERMNANIKAALRLESRPS